MPTVKTTATIISSRRFSPVRSSVTRSAKRRSSSGGTLRPFSDAFLEGYLTEMGERVCQTVGAYEIEGRGAQLFERVAGDQFTIIGLPLLPLLAELRAHGAIGT